jgi:hypothetical protein
MEFGYHVTVFCLMFVFYRSVEGCIVPGGRRIASYVVMGGGVSCFLLCIGIRPKNQKKPGLFASASMCLRDLRA